MRRTVPDPGWKVEWSAGALAALVRLPPSQGVLLRARLAELAELARLAPIPEVGDFEVDRLPLHLVIDDCLVTYGLERQAQVIRVQSIDTL